MMAEFIRAVFWLSLIFLVGLKVEGWYKERAKRDIDDDNSGDYFP